MRLTRYFLPVLKETPADAQIVSHRLMLRAGMARQMAAGIYAWLPLGLKVLRRIERVVDDEQQRAGANPLLMPTVQPAELWRESNRYDAYGPEMLRFLDRHERELLYGPTNEEMITEIFRKSISSYKDLPQLLYHIQWKFRDEIRPRFGVMRGREFLMKDAYSFDLDREGAVHSYNRFLVSYLRTFERLGLTAAPMRAETGPIGGDLSHEFLILAETGESAVYLDSAMTQMRLGEREIDFEDRAALADIVKEWTTPYARADDLHDPAVFEKEVPEERRLTARGIEVGHIFYFGDKYSKPMKAEVAGPDGGLVPVEMGSYGIGVSRLVGALIEANHDENGIIWPKEVAPFDVAIVNLKQGDAAADDASAALYRAFAGAGFDPLYDDREERAGGKFATMDLIGIPWRVTVGPRGLKNGVVELTERRTGESLEVAPEAALEAFIERRAARP